MISFTNPLGLVLRRLTLVVAFTIISAGTVLSQNVVFGPSLQSALQSALPTEQLTVVVTFHGEGALSTTQTSALIATGITQGIVFQSLPIAGVVATPSQINAIAEIDGVRSIWGNDQQEYYNKDARHLTGVEKLRTDSEMRNAMGLPFSGQGVGIVVHDSGVDGTHPDLSLVQNVQGATNPHAVSSLLPINYLEDQDNTDLGSGHGTHVAGTVGGNGQQSGGDHAGVAPGVNMIGYGSGAVLLILDTIGGFDYAISNQFRYGIRIITNSWGSTATFDPEHPVNVASYAAFNRGINVIFAAGNSGPDEATNNRYAAPWSIVVGAGTKAGKLVDFSSRGVKGETLDFTTPDGKSWTWHNEPTVVAPGVDIISTRANSGALPPLEAEADATVLGANAAFYTHMSGTSMATPHVAGIVALMLEANPSLQPADVIDIIRRSASNMPGREAWEVGSGYVNAYAAVQMALGLQDYGSTLTADRAFNAFVDASRNDTPFTIDYNPRPELSSDGNSMTFNVPAGLTTLAARLSAEGVLGETGNPIYPVLISPSGVSHSSGTTLLFTLEYGRAQIVTAPEPGVWTMEIRGIQNGTGNNVVSVPEEVHGTLSFETANGFTGLNDVDGHAAEAAIKSGVGELLFDGYADGTFRPDQGLTRIELAQYLVWGAGIRQADGGHGFGDVSAALAPFAEAVTMHGASMRDREFLEGGVMEAGGAFDPNGSVTRTDLAYSLVRSLGLADAADSFSGDITADFNGTRVPVTDASGLGDKAGYVQIAIDLGLINVYFDLAQGAFESEPTVTARFEPNGLATRADYAVAAVRYFTQY
ncbi:MAG: S8 family serine peptidase [Rhodothermales bacterium]|nr:S8 family serine peptidase [Rhodothermales bacterium]MBO6779548.1 S8 family serine peptidase [Rhodothermales bacterium]